MKAEIKARKKRILSQQKLNVHLPEWCLNEVSVVAISSVAWRLARTQTKFVQKSLTTLVEAVLLSVIMQKWKWYSMEILCHFCCVATLSWVNVAVAVIFVEFFFYMQPWFFKALKLLFVRIQHNLDGWLDGATSLAGPKVLLCYLESPLHVNCSLRNLRVKATTFFFYLFLPNF